LSLRRTAVLVVATVVLASTVAAMALPVAAAGQTSVELVSEQSDLSVGETTTVEVVATNADGGVGAHNTTVALDSEHATITNASAGSAQLERVSVADDGSSATLAVALMDTADQGEVTMATLTIEGTSAGESVLSLRVNALADEQGESYELADTTGTTLTVTGQSSSDGSEQADSTPADGTPSPQAVDDGSDSADTQDQTSQADDGTQSGLAGGLSLGGSVPTLALVGAAALGVVVLGVLVRRRG
jgi:hypothetical protein